MIMPAKPKEIKDRVFEGWDVPAYGPQGKHTRAEWRKECLDNLLAGKAQFEAWQDGWKDKINNDLPPVSLAVQLIYDDGTIEEELHNDHHKVAPETLDFVAHTFDKNLKVRDFKFSGDAYFCSATFTVNAYFICATFAGNANFRSAKFRWWHADFSRSTFARDADFSRSTFTRVADFSSATFTGHADFTNAKFRGFAHFSSAEFIGDCNFQFATFTISADFFKAKFINQCCFKESEFNGEVNFENAVIENVGHFENASFREGELPNFLGVDNAKTLLVFSGDECFNKNDTKGYATNRIAQLKRLAEEHGQTDQMLMFNAFELRAKAKQPTAGSILKITTNLYEYVSDYGRSFAKPIFWYGVLIFLSALFAMIYSTYSDSPPGEQQVLCKPIKDQPPPLKLTYGRAVVEYAMFRAGGLMDFTDTGKQNNAVNCRLFEEPIEPPLMRAWGIFKGIASLALLFLAALGLRNKYRIK